MDVQLTPDQKAFVRHAIESWRPRREEDAVQEALAMWEERERRRREILASVDEAEASLARGEGRSITRPDEVRQLVTGIRERRTARLTAEQNPHS